MSFTKTHKDGCVLKNESHFGWSFCYTPEEKIEYDLMMKYKLIIAEETLPLELRMRKLREKGIETDKDWEELNKKYEEAKKKAYFLVYG